MALHDKPLSDRFVDIMKDCMRVVEARIRGTRLAVTILMYDMKTGEWSVTGNVPASDLPNVLQATANILRRKENSGVRSRLILPR